MVHSEEDYNAAVEASGILFGNATSEALKKLDEDTLLAVFEGVPRFEVSRDALAEGVKAVDLFVDNAAVFASKGEMRKLVQGGGDCQIRKERFFVIDIRTEGENIHILSFHFFITSYSHFISRLSPSAVHPQPLSTGYLRPEQLSPVHWLP